MRIVIDMQGAQSESRFRGIGRYTLAFARALARGRGAHEVYLVLNGLFDQTIEPIRAAFADLLPQENIKVWYAPGPVRAMYPDHAARRGMAEWIREAFIAQLKPDVVHLSSLFEGYNDDAVVSLHHVPPGCRVSVSFYDLIPYLNPAQYLTPRPLYAQFYNDKMEQLKRVDTGLAISRHAQQEALEHLPELTGKMVNVSTAADAQFQTMVMDTAQAKSWLKKWGVERPFVLYTGGADERKNLPRLVQAYAGLPSATRESSQLLLAGKLASGSVNELKAKAKSLGLRSDELLFSGYVSDEDLVRLYNLCRLFVFPSWQEGFGLPALEAMSCGAVVIGASTSSLPEVIGLDAALFDPFSVASMTAKMQQAMCDEGFRAALRTHGLKQAQNFSWDSVARKALAAWACLPAPASVAELTPKPRLALVSPLPPERTGIADYSAELLPALAEHYHVELILAQDRVELEGAVSNFVVRDVAWFRAHPEHYDRILYQFGNSPFHQHMLDLLEEIPGTVVLHDFYLSGLMSWLENHGGQTHAWKQALLNDHGYGALQALAQDPQAAVLTYPVNGHVFRHALGVIVHSQHARQLIEAHYGAAVVSRVRVVPLLRQPPRAIFPSQARQDLGLAADDFVVCSFGFLDATKLNDRLLEAWIGSRLLRDPRCKLFFVGQNAGGEFGDALRKTIESRELSNQIRITGFVSQEQYRQYLSVADLAVQLRTNSRGETSAAALDVLNHGVAMIVNAHGSMAELDSQKVWMLEDRFEVAQLTQALETLWQDPKRRLGMGRAGQAYGQTLHAPQACAAAYAKAMEEDAPQGIVRLADLLPTVASQMPDKSGEASWYALAHSLALSFPTKRLTKRIYLDVTATRSVDRKTGIERVTRALVLALLHNPPAGYLAEPVFLSNVAGQFRYRKAVQYTLELLQCPSWGLSEEPVEPQQGDVLLVLDLSGARFVDAQAAGLHERYRQRGVSVYALVYDLLPVRMPEVFPPGADQRHANWLHAISSLDGALSISKAVRDDLVQWQIDEGLSREDRRSFRAAWFHLGADLSASLPTQGLPESAPALLNRLAICPTFLMVGTIEPRKAYLQVLEAFTQLWAKGRDIHLVIVGREGWLDLAASERRDIPQVMAQLRHHPEKQKHLHWLDNISDEYLEKVYAASSCLLAASWGEGFGLPLIEAAHHQLPILARDIPVFREVAGPYASYFTAADAASLANAIEHWLKQGADHVPQSHGMAQLTWAQSAQELMAAVLGQEHLE
jgi:glycosyltransferase involved in cell wall biosynthesis